MLVNLKLANTAKFLKPYFDTAIFVFLTILKESLSLSLLFSMFHSLD